jgi:hypothetical protein
VAEPNEELVEVSVERRIADADRLAVQATVGRRNVGPLRAEREIASTGRRFEVFPLRRLPGRGRLHPGGVDTDRRARAIEQLENLPTGPERMAGIAPRQLRWRLGGRKRLD